MSHDHRYDDPAHGREQADETRMVDRQPYADQSQTVRDGGYVPPPAPYVAPVQPAGSQVNVNAGGGGRPAYVDRGRSALYYARRVLSLLFAILIVLIAIRVILLALGANEANQIVDFVYGITEPFVAPFRGMFSIDQVRPGDGVNAFDLAAVVAAVGWLLIYLLLMAVLSLADRDRTA